MLLYEPLAPSSYCSSYCRMSEPPFSAVVSRSSIWSASYVGPVKVGIEAGSTLGVDGKEAKARKRELLLVAPA